MRESRQRVSVLEYDRMVHAGILTTEDHVELIDGEILPVSPMGEPHAAVVSRVAKLLTLAFVDESIVRVQSPIVLGDWSEPEPDIAVVRPRDDFYSGKHPTSEDILFLVEVSDSSVVFDRDVKIPLYSAHQIPESWVVDIQSDTLSVFRGPGSHGYEQTTNLKAGDLISPLALPHHVFRVGAIVPSH